MSAVIDVMPWERQPRETQRAYEAFIAYRDQAPPRRLRIVAEDLACTVQNVHRWVNRWRWHERVLAWDNWTQAAKDRGALEAIEDMNRRHSQLAMAMSAKVAARLAVLNPDELSPGEIGRWMQVISMVERLARGEATQRVDGKTGPDLHVQVNNAEQQVVFDRAYIGDVLDRLAARGVVPTPRSDALPEGDTPSDQGKVSIVHGGSSDGTPAQDG